MEIRFDPNLLKVLQEKENEEKREEKFIRLCMKYHLCPKCHIGIKIESIHETHTTLKCSNCKTIYKVMKRITSKVEEIIR